jgi:hypothetical protein
LLKFYFCLSTTTLVCHHSFMHACYTEKERDAHCCSFFYFWQNQAWLLGGDRQQLPQLWMRRSQSFLHTWSHKSSSSSSSSSSC